MSAALRIPLLRGRLLRRAWATILSTPAGREAILDLRRVCYADKPTFHTDPSIMAFREGMRTVFLRITGYANLSEHEIEAMAQQVSEDYEQ